MEGIIKNENKYSKILNKSWRLLFGIVIIISCSCLLVVPFVAQSMYNDKIPDILAIVSTSLAGFLIYQGINMAFFNQEYETTGIVHDGETIIQAKQTPKYIKRTMWFCFIECLLHGVLALYFLIRASITDYAIIYIIIAIISIVIAVVYFLNAGKRKVDLQNHKNQQN